MNVAYIKKQLLILLAYRGCDVEASYLKEKDLILKQANELVNHIFSFDKPWDMERCTIPYQLPIMIDWNTSPHDDEEWIFMLNRMDYLSYLIQAFVLEKQDIYLNTCKDLIIQWIQAHPTLLLSPSTRTLDSAIRLSNMMDAMSYLFYYKALSDREIELITTYFYQQIKSLKDQYVAKYTLSNWGSIQTCVIIYLLPLIREDYLHHPIFQWASKELIRQVNIQIYEDGMFWEQSTMYHIEVLNYLMRTIFMKDVFSFPLNDIIHEKAYALCDALALQVTPHHEIEAFGDSDRCSIEDVFARATYLFKQPGFKHLAAANFDIESTYCFGSHPALSFQAVLATKEQRLFYDGMDSGMFTVRSSWAEDASYTMFTNGSLGSGHGHCDNLHISLYFKGKPFLIDTGRYTYQEQNILRPYLKSMGAHNTIIIDDLPHSIPKGSWDYENFGIVQRNLAKHDGQIHYYEGAIVDEGRQGIHTRKMIVIDTCIWLICDELLMQGNHRLTQFFHLDPKVQYNDENGILLTHDEVKLCADFHHSSLCHQKPCSLRYNELQDHSVIQIKAQFSDTHTMFTSFYDHTITRTPIAVYQDDKIAPSELVEAFQFTISKQVSYTVILFHKEIYTGRKICFCDGVAFHAKSVVIHKKAGKTTLHRLKC